MKKFASVSLALLVTLLLFAGEKQTWLDSVKLNFGGTGIFQYTPQAIDSLGREKSFSAVSMSFDLELIAALGENGNLFAHLQAGQGDGLDAKIATLGGVNGDADNDTNVRLTELVYSHSLPYLTIAAGKVSLSSDFDTNNIANSETEQFLNGGLINNPALEFPADNGAGMILKFNPAEWVTLALAAAEADADWNDPLKDGFFIGEVDLTLPFGEFNGNYRVYGWSNGTDRPKTDGSDDILEGNTGFGVSIDHSLPMGLGVFARWGIQDKDAAEIESALSAGLSWIPEPLGRVADLAGLGIGALAPSGDGDAEMAVEFFYRCGINEHVTVTPDIIYVSNPGGDADMNPVMIMGIRTNVSF